MALVLVLHDPDGDRAVASEMRVALRDAIWEVADAHWALSESAVIAATDLSPDYLLSHFSRAIARRGHKAPGQLLIVPIGERSVFAGLPEQAANWVHDRRD